MPRVENVATPATAFTCAVPFNAPPDGFVPRAIVTWFVAVVTTLPEASSMLTVTAGAIGLPAATLLGWTVNTNFAAEPTTLKGVLDMPVSPVALAESVSPVPALLMLRFEKVATPATAVEVAVPLNVPPDGFVTAAIVTALVAVGTTCPAASSMLTVTVIVLLPAGAFPGC